MSHPNYKLTYLDIRGWGETARFIFAYKGIPYEDVRFSRDELPAMKATMPFRMAPILTVDGKVYGQSGAFSRMLAKRYGLAGKDDEEQAHVDAIYDYGKDIWAATVKWWFEPDPAKQKAMNFDKTLDEFLEVLESHLTGYGGGQFFAPSGVTFADFFIATILTIIDERIPGTLARHSAIKEHVNRVHNLPGIKEWVAVRPKSEF
ncbi:putative Glutathione S-transferase 1 [Hypsibius exemplaris]|uniref:Glutathione S-transferase 1 n=1 Tax=Hypsibius exemplaris TaxID=2072580 RepID=A0A9X6N992_HYPEX|nr:putative Glutathione S-transferase 1 [Hypsibius exemplaris]